MSGLPELLKATAMNTIEASKLTEPIVGTVTGENPLTISIGSKMALSGSKLILMKGLGLEKGDKVLIIRASGGQKFYVMGEVAQ